MAPKCHARGASVLLLHAALPTVAVGEVMLSVTLPSEDVEAVAVVRCAPCAAVEGEAR